MHFIVTIKLAKNPKHDPKNKQTNICPLDIFSVCTDITGEHHSFLYEAPESWGIEQVTEYWKIEYHVTRVEGVNSWQQRVPTTQHS